MKLLGTEGSRCVIDVTPPACVVMLLLLRAATEVGAQDCGAGANPDGSGGCADCAAGTFSATSDDSGCGPCPAGSFAQEGATECTACAAGLHDHDQSAATPCEYCPVGRFTLEDEAQACQSCQNGSRWMRSHTACAACPRGFSEPEPGAEHCESCLAGTFSPAVLLRGCKDPVATNFNALANIDDGSCACEGAHGCSSVRWERWEGIPGATVAALTSSSAYTDGLPVYSGNLLPGDVLEVPENVNNNAGTRLTAYFVAPQTGDYTFVMASDDQGELWLGPEESTAELIASVPGSTSTREWDKHANQTSSPQTLQAGSSYFVMALAKEDSGDDHLAVGVTLPDGTDLRPIPVADYLFLPSQAAVCPIEELLLDIDWTVRPRLSIAIHSSA